MVVYVFGEVGGSIGPLPYSMRECRQRAIDSHRMIPLDAVVFKDGTLHGDVKFRCEWHETKPQVEYKVNADAR